MKFSGMDITCSAAMVLGVFCAAAATAQTPPPSSFSLESPGKKLSVTVDAKDGLNFSVKRGETVLVSNVEISMDADGTVLPAKDAAISSKTRAYSTQYQVPVPVKESTLKEAFSELRLDFGEDVSVVFRAYDDAAAYRFETRKPGDLTVKSENCTVSFPAGAEAWFAFPKDFMNDYQHVYEKLPVAALGKKMTQLPLLVDVGTGGKVMVTESDLQDYPGMYFVAGEGGALASTFPPAVKSEKPNDPKKRRWDRVFYPKETFDYIAKTSGTRTFPWRIFATAEKDTDLLNNEIVYKLAEPSRLEDTSWIKPGLVAWDWWNAWNITGVDFKSGPNTDTYKYYIDFAARNGIPYVILDEGWYELGDIMKQVPDIDVPQLVAYGKEKGVDLILWAVWRTLDDKMEEALSLFEQWGIKGIKIDFMNRDDQDVVNFYWRCAKAAADHKLMVDFHGAHKPTGLQRTYPNVMTFEGFPGGEEVKWSDKTTTPGMTTSLPYIRMFTGPLDYTPGAMRNATEKDFKPIFNTPMSMGTRCMQLAMYVIFESPLQMLCDTPTMYEKEKECLDFIVKVPTTWDQTFPLDGKVGEYVVMARRKGTSGKAEFFAGAMTNWTPRDLEIDTSFLLDGEYQAVIFQDGINAPMNATDYKRVEQTVKKGDKLKVHLAPGGGWAARFTRK
jgi:alpha-glucosidase